MIVIADSSALVAVATYRGLDLLETLFGNFIRSSLLETDKNTRIAGMDRDDFAEYGHQRSLNRHGWRQRTNRCQYEESSDRCSRSY